MNHKNCWREFIKWKTKVLNAERPPLGDLVYGQKTIDALDGMDQADRFTEAWGAMTDAIREGELTDIEINLFCLYNYLNCRTCQYRAAKGGCGPGSQYFNAMEELGALGADALVNVLGLENIAAKVKEIEAQEGAIHERENIL